MDWSGSPMDKEFLPPLFHASMTNAGTGLMSLEFHPPAGKEEVLLWRILLLFLFILKVPACWRRSSKSIRFLEAREFIVSVMPLPASGSRPVSFSHLRINHIGGEMPLRRIFKDTMERSGGETLRKVRVSGLLWFLQHIPCHLDPPGTGSIPGLVAMRSKGNGRCLPASVRLRLLAVSLADTLCRIPPPIGEGDGLDFGRFTPRSPIKGFDDSLDTRVFLFTCTRTGYDCGVTGNTDSNSLLLVPVQGTRAFGAHSQSGSLSGCFMEPSAHNRAHPGSSRLSGQCEYALPEGICCQLPI